MVIHFGGKMENVWLSVQITVRLPIGKRFMQEHISMMPKCAREAVHIVFASILQFSSRESYSLITFAIFSTKGVSTRVRQTRDWYVIIKYCANGTHKFVEMDCENGGTLILIWFQIIYLPRIRMMTILIDRKRISHKLFCVKNAFL